MGEMISFYRKNFINSLSESNKKEMKIIDLGYDLKIDGYCGSVFNGRLESFEEDGIILTINKKSKVIIKSEGIKKIKKI